MQDSDRNPERRRLIRRLESTTELSAEERQALLDLPMTLREFEAGQDIARAGDRPQHCGLVVTGFACRYMLLADGRRQIVAVHPPGDIPDLQSLHLRVMDHSICAKVPTTIALIAHDHVQQLLQHPGLAQALWRETLIDAATFRAWMVGLGRRTAHERIAHLLCEMTLRFEAVGLAPDRTFQLPLTQSNIADALGLSNVHVNRVLQDLRRDELIVWRRSSVQVLRWSALQELALFDPGYLHLRAAPVLSGNLSGSGVRWGAYSET